MKKNNDRKFHVTDSPEVARVYLEEALSFLDENHISPTPVNYLIGYEKAANRDEVMVRALEKRSGRSGIIDGHLLKDLFDEFYLSEPDANFYSQMGGIQQMLTQMLKQVADAGDGVSNYSKTLESSLDQLQANPGSESVEQVVRGLVEATQLVAKSNEDLQETLSDVQHEADVLKTELEEVRKESEVDAMTGLLNRRKLTQLLDRQIVEAKSAGTPLSLLLLDIDHFKKFNDTFGHLIGDEVIRRVGATVKRHVRGTDIAARFGGEEFTIALPDTSMDGALTVAKTIHAGISKLALVKKSTKEKLPGITVSVGVASLGPDDDQESILDRADSALYRAKQTGRNRIISEDELEEPVEAVG